MDTPPVPPSPPAPPPPPPPPPAPPPPPPRAAGAPGSNRTVIIVLCIVGALVLIIGGCTFACVHYVRKGVRKAKQYSETAQKNPQMAAIEFAAAMSPNIEIVSKDESTGKITLRNKKTGEVVTLDSRKLTSEGTGEALDQIMRGTKPAAVVAESQEETEPAPAPAAPARRSPPAEPTVTSARASAFAATLRKFPDFIPAYRGGTTVGATLNSFGGNVVGNYSFTTSDAPEAAADFYEKRLTSAGFNIISKQNDANDNGPTVTLVAQHPSSQVTATCKAEIENEKTQVEISFVKPGGG